MAWIRRLRLRSLYWVLEPMGEFVGLDREELDYRNEAGYLERLRRNALDNPKERVPEVVPELSGERILVLEYLDGPPVLDYVRALESGDELAVRRLAASGFVPAVFARAVDRNFLSDAFLHGLFHADLHPANLLILPDNVVGYIDFGITGVLSAYSRRHLVAMTLAYTRGDLDGMCDAFFKVSTLEPGRDPRQFRPACPSGRVWYGGARRRTAPGEELHPGDARHAEVSRATGVWPERDIIKYIRSSIALDGLIERFRPGSTSGSYLAQVCTRHLRAQGLRTSSPPRDLGGALSGSRLARDGALRGGRDARPPVERRAAAARRSACRRPLRCGGAPPSSRRRRVAAALLLRFGGAPADSACNPFTGQILLVATPWRPCCTPAGRRERNRMRELTKSMTRFSWAMSLFGARHVEPARSGAGQPRLRIRHPRRRGAARRVLARHLPHGDRLQRSMVDAAFSVVQRGGLDPSTWSGAAQQAVDFATGAVRQASGAAGCGCAGGLRAPEDAPCRAAWSQSAAAFAWGWLALRAPRVGARLRRSPELWAAGMGVPALGCPGHGLPRDGLPKAGMRRWTRGAGVLAAELDRASWGAARALDGIGPARSTRPATRSATTSSTSCCRPIRWRPQAWLEEAGGRGDVGRQPALPRAGPDGARPGVSCATRSRSSGWSAVARKLGVPGPGEPFDLRNWSTARTGSTISRRSGRSRAWATTTRSTLAGARRRRGTRCSTAPLAAGHRRVCRREPPDAPRRHRARPSPSGCSPTRRRGSRGRARRVAEVLELCRAGSRPATSGRPGVARPGHPDLPPRPSPRSTRAARLGAAEVRATLARRRRALYFLPINFLPCGDNLAAVRDGGWRAAAARRLRRRPGGSRLGDRPRQHAPAGDPRPACCWPPRRALRRRRLRQRRRLVADDALGHHAGRAPGGAFPRPPAAAGRRGARRACWSCSRHAVQEVWPRLR